MAEIAIYHCINYEKFEKLCTNKKTQADDIEKKEKNGMRKRKQVKTSERKFWLLLSAFNHASNMCLQWKVQGRLLRQDSLCWLPLPAQNSPRCLFMAATFFRWPFPSFLIPFLPSHLHRAGQLHHSVHVTILSSFFFLHFPLIFCLPAFLSTIIRYLCNNVILSILKKSASFIFSCSFILKSKHRQENQQEKRLI